MSGFLSSLRLAALTAAAALSHAYAQGAPLAVRSRSGSELLVVEENRQPVLRIILPGRPRTDRSIEVLFPEHVTAVREGSTTAERLYQFAPGDVGERPVWQRVGQSLEYHRQLPGGVAFLARATLEDDGVRFRYEFVNLDAANYQMIYAVTDPRLTGLFHDQRLQRTFVHHSDGFDLLASEIPSRLTAPLEEWLPARVLASHTWPIPAARIERRDGITHYNKSRALDLPFIATVSADSVWVIASLARESGNVWSNPALTCQHVDPQASLAAGQRVVLEVKLLVLRGSLTDALQQGIRQRASLGVP